jgi:hypothetical protein
VDLRESSPYAGRRTFNRISYLAVPGLVSVAEFLQSGRKYIALMSQFSMKARELIDSSLEFPDDRITHPLDVGVRSAEFFLDRALQ